MSQQNKEENLLRWLPLHHMEELTSISDDLLNHEINFCREMISNNPNIHYSLKVRLRVAEDELERRVLLS